IQCDTEQSQPLTAHKPVRCTTYQEDLKMRCFCMATEDNKLCNSILSLFDPKGTGEQKNRNTFLRDIGIIVSTGVDPLETEHIEFDADF
ncbi:hypothetical protein PENTCL1PPCAC_24476, partial [Pristionchus entomophagus]